MIYERGGREGGREGGGERTSDDVDAARRSLALILPSLSVDPNCKTDSISVVLPSCSSCEESRSAFFLLPSCMDKVSPVAGHATARDIKVEASRSMDNYSTNAPHRGREKGRPTMTR